MQVNTVSLKAADIASTVYSGLAVISSGLLTSPGTVNVMDCTDGFDSETIQSNVTDSPSVAETRFCTFAKVGPSEREENTPEYY